MNRTSAAQQSVKTNGSAEARAAREQVRIEKELSELEPSSASAAEKMRALGAELLELTRDAEKYLVSRTAIDCFESFTFSPGKHEDIITVLFSDVARAQSGRTYLRELVENPESEHLSGNPSEKTWLRVLAATALVKSHETKEDITQAIKFLTEMSSEQPSSQILRAALKGLVGQPEATMVFFDALRHRDSFVGEIALQGLAGVPEAREMLEGHGTLLRIGMQQRAVLSLLETPDSESNLMTIIRAGKLHDENAELLGRGIRGNDKLSNELQELLKDSKEDRRLIAAIGLAGNKQARKGLEKVLKRDESFAVRMEAARALGVENKKALKFLVDSFEGKALTVPFVLRIKAAKLLSQHPEGRKLIEEALEPKGFVASRKLLAKEKQIAAAAALQDSPKASSVLARALSDGSAGREEQIELLTDSSAEESRELQDAIVSILRADRSDRACCLAAKSLANVPETLMPELFSERRSAREEIVEILSGVFGISEGLTRYIEEECTLRKEPGETKMSFRTKLP